MRAGLRHEPPAVGVRMPAVPPAPHHSVGIG